MPQTRTRVFLAACALAGVAMGLLPLANAALGPLDTLVMPGKVIQGHEKLEKDCRKCHVPFQKEAQSQLCIECHDHAEIAKDIRTRRGFHGRISDKACNMCHTEHKGRNVNIAPIDEKKFDHRQTNFPLAGGHLAPKVKCEDCHKPGRKYRTAPVDCYACHQKDDVHKGGLGKKCVNCHVDRNWKQVRFDHSKTDFPLQGKHLDTECHSCHIKERYKKTPKDCYSCHKSDDNKKGHKGRFGRKCETCHVADAWGEMTFDHNRDTKYRLRGKHAQVKCTSCHQGILYQEKLGTECYACHRKDDEHKGRYGRKCASCHVERSWKSIIFDHNRNTKYPLRGKHKQVACQDCHKGILYQEQLPKLCIGCHEKDDAHKGQEGKQCERCHNESSWTEKTFFDHGLTRFPLLGKHEKVKCKDCHKEPTFKDASIECYACHKKDDTHKRRLGPQCGVCHNARDWKAWDFDHNKRTNYRLDGAHKRLACYACHKRPVRAKIRLSSSCMSCHDIDDVHAGEFGRFCERCHVTSSFKMIKTGGRLLQ